MLSNKQFGELGKTLRSGGGFSINVHTGKSPTDGFMVAASGSTESPLPAATVHGRNIRAFAQHPPNAEQLSQPNRYLGGWGGKSVAVLDVSQNIRPKADVAAQYGDDVAHADARTSTADLLYARNEEAAYDVRGKKDYDNPVYDPKRPKNKPGQ